MKSETPALTIAKQLISIDTTTKFGVKTAMKWLKDWAKEHDLHTVTFPDTSAVLIQTNPLAPKHFSFVTHIDVVPAMGWSNAFKPEIKNNYLIGRGAVDDKGPLAICLDILVKSKLNSNVNVSCLVITDEETVNTEIHTVIHSKTYNPDFSLVVDGGTHTQMDIGQKGIVRAELTIKTAGGHSAFEDKKDSACLQLLGVISQLNDFAETLPNDSEFAPTFINVSTFISETVPYGLPQTAKANIEIQFPSPQNSTVWLQQLEKIKNEKPNLKFKIHWISEPHLLRDKEILKIFTSLGIENITTGGNNLAKELVLSGIPASSHCPVRKYVAHCNEEKISLSDIKKGISLYLKIIESFTTIRSKGMYVQK